MVTLCGMPTHYTRSPLKATFGTGKNSHYMEFPLSETDPFQANLFSQCDISSALVEFVLNDQFVTFTVVEYF